ncbi:hypothetical protein ACOME3_003981 [Neoechinorhynchus agilis]
MSAVGRASSEAKKRVGKILSKMKATGDKIEHPPYIRVWIGAGRATAAPPLGSMLGQRGLNIAKFCKDYNELTSNYKEGIPLPTMIYIKPDRSFTIEFINPPLSFLIMQAAGINRGPMDPKREIAGVITLKHVYEIANVKKDDKLYAFMSMEQLCKTIIRLAVRTGIKVVPRISPEELGQFRNERKVIVEKQLQELQDLRTSKMLRTATN